MFAKFFTKPFKNNELPKHFNAHNVIPKIKNVNYQFANMAIDRAKVRDLGRVFPFIVSSTTQELVDKKKQAITVKTTDKASTLLEKLRQNHIQGALVVDDKGTPSGWIDVLDIMNEMIYRSNIQGVHITEEDKKKLTEDGKAFAQRTCKELINASGRDPLVNVIHTRPMIEALRSLTKAHRILVNYFDENHVVAQLDVISYFLLHHNNVVAMLHKPMLEAGMVPENIVGSMNENNTIMGAMRYIRDCNVSGIAITDNDGKLITNLSASDFLNVPLDKFSIFGGSIKTFLQQTRTSQMKPISCRINDTMETLFHRMDKFKVHRIYIVDNVMKPVGFVSLTDIMEFLTETGS